jgi:hypothetical protein
VHTPLVAVVVDEEIATNRDEIIEKVDERIAAHL